MENLHVLLGILAWWKPNRCSPSFVPCALFPFPDNTKPATISDRQQQQRSIRWVLGTSFCLQNAVTSGVTFAFYIYRTWEIRVDYFKLDGAKNATPMVMEEGPGHSGCWRNPNPLLTETEKIRKLGRRIIILYGLWSLIYNRKRNSFWTWISLVI